jgi:hypothetical protein
MLMQWQDPYSKRNNDGNDHLTDPPVVTTIGLAAQRGASYADVTITKA